MCKFWRKFCRADRKNRNFPELANPNNLRSWLWNLVGCRSGVAVIVALNIVAAFFYLTQTNLTATQGYQIKSLEKQLAQLEQEHDVLSLDYIQLQSMEKIVNGAKNFNLVPSDNMETLKVDEIAINR